MMGDKCPPVLACFGNPLLDIIAPDEDAAIVEKYSLDKNVAQEMDTVTSGLYDDVVARYFVFVVPL